MQVNSKAVERSGDPRPGSATGHKISLTGYGLGGETVTAPLSSSSSRRRVSGGSRVEGAYLGHHVVPISLHRCHGLIIKTLRKKGIHPLTRMKPLIPLTLSSSNIRSYHFKNLYMDRTYRSYYLRSDSLHLTFIAAIERH